MLRASLLVALLLAGCAAPIEPQSATTTADAMAASATTAPLVPKPAPPPPPQVGTCDLTVTSAGTGTGAVRSSGCQLANAIPSLSKDARSLLVEVTWSSLPPTVLQLKSSLENPAACGGQPILGGGCSELATNTSMAAPVRIVLDGDAFAKYAAGSTLYENVYEGADAQQAFHVAFSAFQQEHVPANYTALK